MSAGLASVAVDRVDVGGGPALGLVTLSRPGEMNPLDWDTMRELGRALDALAAEPAIRVIAITGAQMRPTPPEPPEPIAPPLEHDGGPEDRAGDGTEDIPF